MADLATCPPLTRASVVEAHSVVKPYVHYTPVVTNATLTAMASTPRTEEELKGTAWAGRTPARPTMRLFFKCENLQRTGAFKIRGAFHALERLQREPGWKEGGGMERGVVTHSSGKRGGRERGRREIKERDEGGGWFRPSSLPLSVGSKKGEQETTRRRWPWPRRRPAYRRTS